ncbi:MULTISPECIES: hypothetical protein [Saccharothrix]|uniref:hypothetical protein n=1 Tax=Saccharothrix TaxID=2071 RepID=UPI0009397E80|nr:hypothetical protein [Saccharothrix sp. CB00851]OKI33419.1 hypothetical protein A6A25_06560 [Saccharothrix sp. CB00851]
MGTEHRRTLLGELLHERGLTAEEFSEQANRYAYEHGIDATLSARHVHRLASGQRADGRPLGAPRQGTKRLLEQMLGVPIDRLLRPSSAPRSEVQNWSSEALELRARIMSGRNVDQHTVSLLQEKLNLTRVIDRRLGGATLLSELRAQIDQMWQLLGDILNHRVRVSLASVIADASTLAGWQSLDRGAVRESWQLYDQARAAARVAESRSLEAYACAGQAVVLLDIGDSQSAVDLTGHALQIAQGHAPPFLTAWLMAAHGETLAANGRHTDSLQAFDVAAQLIATKSDRADAPYLVFDQTHLTRWRGSALARLGKREAIDVLGTVLERLDPTFTRAETALRVDLVQVLSANGERAQAAAHAERARLLAAQIGSSRQRRRLEALIG